MRSACRNCGSHRSVRYPLVELLTGVIWLITAIRYGFTLESVALVYLFSILIAAAFIDVEHMIIPNGLVLSGLAGGMAVFLCHILYRPFDLYGSASWYAPFIGMVSASGILFLVAITGFLIYKDDGAMGMGDVKLFLPIGMFLGWRLALLSLVIAVLIGGAISVILLIFKIKDRKSAIPFSPFIVAASFIAGLFGLQML